MELLGFQLGNANAHSVFAWSHHRANRAREEAAAARRNLSNENLPQEDQDRDLMLTAFSL